MYEELFSLLSLEKRRWKGKSSNKYKKKKSCYKKDDDPLFSIHRG